MLVVTIVLNICHMKNEHEILYRTKGSCSLRGEFLQLSLTIGTIELNIEEGGGWKATHK